MLWVIFFMVFVDNQIMQQLLCLEGISLCHLLSQLLSQLLFQLLLHLLSHHGVISFYLLTSSNACRNSCVVIGSREVSMDSSHRSSGNTRACARAMPATQRWFQGMVSIELDQLQGQGPWNKQKVLVQTCGVKHLPVKSSTDSFVLQSRCQASVTTRLCNDTVHYTSSIDFWNFKMRSRLVTVSSILL